MLQTPRSPAGVSGPSVNKMTSPVEWLFLPNRPVNLCSQQNKRCKYGKKSSLWLLHASRRCCGTSRAEPCCEWPQSGRQHSPSPGEAPRSLPTSGPSRAGFFLHVSAPQSGPLAATEGLLHALQTGLLRGARLSTAAPVHSASAKAGSAPHSGSGSHVRVSERSADRPLGQQPEDSSRSGSLQH